MAWAIASRIMASRPDLDPTLGLVLQMVPQLRRCCTASTTTQHDYESRTPDVKTLRLVNKLFNDIMKSEVNGFCLKLRSQFILSARQSSCLTGTALHPLKAWTFLQGAQLHRLAIQIQGEDLPRRGAPGMLKTGFCAQLLCH